MAISVQGQIISSVALTVSQSQDLLTAGAPLSYTKSIDFTSGTGSNQADQVYADSFTGTADVTVSLEGGSAPNNPMNEQIDLAGVRAILIKNNATTTGYKLEIGAAASNPLVSGLFADATDKIVIGPGGMLVLTAPLDAIPVGSGSLALKIARGGNSIPFDIIVLGVTA